MASIKACRGKGFLSLSAGNVGMTAEGRFAPMTARIYVRSRLDGFAYRSGRHECPLWLHRPQLFLPPEKAAGKRPLKGETFRRFPLEKFLFRNTSRISMAMVNLLR
ncbi:MAG: hypothetical protein VB035_03780 [Candidatus Fimivivens sp.]|nr:hypothetical protein [Candidatus Fimivivens sp.]